MTCVGVIEPATLGEAAKSKRRTGNLRRNRRRRSTEVTKCGPRGRSRRYACGRARRSSYRWRGDIPHTRLLARMNEIPRDKPLLVHCFGGGRSARACALLQKNGFDVMNLAGGFTAWRQRLKKGLVGVGVKWTEIGTLRSSCPKSEPDFFHASPPGRPREPSCLRTVRRTDAWRSPIGRKQVSRDPAAEVAGNKRAYPFWAKIGTRCKRLLPPTLRIAEPASFAGVLNPRELQPRFEDVYTQLLSARQRLRDERRHTLQATAARE